MFQCRMCKEKKHDDEYAGDDLCIECEGDVYIEELYAQNSYEWGTGTSHHERDTSR